MRPYHIITVTEGVLVTSWYYGYSKEKSVMRKEFLSYGDSFTIEGDFKYIQNAGWFILINVHEGDKIFVSFDVIDECMSTGKIIEVLELQIQLLLLQHQLDRALDHKERELFYMIAPKLNGVLSLMDFIKPKEVMIIN